MSWNLRKFWDLSSRFTAEKLNYQTRFWDITPLPHPAEEQVPDKIIPPP